MTTGRINQIAVERYRGLGADLRSAWSPSRHGPKRPLRRATPRDGAIAGETRACVLRVVRLGETEPRRRVPTGLCRECHDRRTFAVRYPPGCSAPLGLGEREEREPGLVLPQVRRGTVRLLLRRGEFVTERTLAFAVRGSGPRGTGSISSGRARLVDTLR
jgi:hypothetical protein